jgi:hypothetical protein
MRYDATLRRMQRILLPQTRADIGASAQTVTRPNDATHPVD